MPVAWSLLVSYAGMLTVLVLLLVQAGSQRPGRLLLVVLAPVFLISHYLGLKALSGWPSNEVENIKADMRLLATVVEEGNAKDPQSAIYLWLGDSQDPQLPPRAFRLPYGSEQHKAVIAAQRRQARGRPQLATISREPAASTSSGMAGGSGAGYRIQFRDQPRPTLPPK